MGGKGKDKSAPKGKGKGKAPPPPKGKGKGKAGKAPPPAPKGVPGKGKAGKGKGKGKGEVLTWTEKKPTVLVTGASGFVAGRVIKNLLSKGYTVRGTVRSLENTDKISHLKDKFPKVELFEADLLGGPEAFEKAMEGCKYVMHCASPFQLSVDDPQKDLIDPALKGTEAVMNAAGKAKVSRVVVTSSCAAVGPPQTWMAKPEDADKEKVFTEEDWNTTSSLEAGPYRYSKVLAEKKAFEIAKEVEGLDVVSICPSFVLGPPLSKRVDGESARFIEGLLNGKMKETGCKGSIGLGCVDVRDVANAHVSAMEVKEAGGKRFIMSSEEGYGKLELAEMIRKKFAAYPLPTTGDEVLYKPKYSSEQAKTVLKVKLTPINVSMASMAGAAVALGIVERKTVLKKTKFGKVENVQPDSKAVDLMLKVVSCTKTDETEKGEPITEAVAGDASGVVTLRMIPAETTGVEEGKTISVRNGYVQMIKGYIRVRAGKWGKITVEEDPGEEIVPNKTKDMSSTEYELVTQP